ncbi:hypothetical protein IU470_15900 [Nocardia abscessus]|uniref:Uncharacterized protein n=1 Tax=Nocardia abscessus TaxID=120957 RepID=A0ABS0CAL2_9NOCA|nr:hypothetical protein [Nocardia abscessus]MBF6226577.1 hypothetical protein [Nocardia abscessus]
MAGARGRTKSPENPMGLVSDITVVGGIAYAAIYAFTRLLALLIVLRGTQPEHRAELVRAVAELFPQPRLPRPYGRTTRRIR